MQNTRSLAFFSMASGILAVISLCLMAAALHNIQLAMDPSLSTEWSVIQIGVPIFVVLQAASIAGFFKLVKIISQEGQPAEIAAEFS